MNIQRQLDDSEDTIEKLKAERDEAERNLEQTMKELGEIAWITYLSLPEIKQLRKTSLRW